MFNKNKNNSSSWSPKVNLVVYNERYSDIKAQVYHPREETLVEAHPCTFLNPDILCNQGFPNGFSLSPEEALKLWEALKHVFQHKKDVWNQWDPEIRFKSKEFLTRNDAREYEISLKNKVVEYLKNNGILL